jgi:heat-inducible transcriptional repressor
VERHEERLVVSGAAHLVRQPQESVSGLAPLLEALEEQVVLLKLLGESAIDQDVQVRIGHEHDVDRLASTAVVASSYGVGEKAVGRLGVVGPTHMDYAASMAAVSAVASYVGKIVAES